MGDVLYVTSYYKLLIKKINKIKNEGKSKLKIFLNKNRVCNLKKRKKMCKQTGMMEGMSLCFSLH